MIIDKETFIPKKSSWTTRKTHLSGVSSNLNNKTTSTVKIIPEIHFEAASAGEIFNTYQKLVVNSKWDVRMNGNIPSLLLGRGHMFYYNNLNTPKKITELVQANFKDINQKYKSLITDKNDYSNLYKGLYAGVFLEQNLESGSRNLLMMESYGMTDPKDITSSNDYLEKSITRKMSENHFAISYFNLIGYEISVDDGVANVISSSSSTDNKVLKNHLTILPVKFFEDNYNKESMDIKYNEKVIQLNSKLNNDKDVKLTYSNYEFLLNGLMNEMSNAYFGKIYIKFNNDIEIGDTITLLDINSSTYGVFEIESFEHSFDERGLITTLNVKASVTLSDPCLDAYSLNVGYEISKKFEELCLLETSGSVTDNFKLQNIYGFYLQQLLQMPKYIQCFYLNGDDSGIMKTVKEILFTRMKNLEYMVPPMPIKFMPFFRKGKCMIPKGIEPALTFQNDEFKNILEELKQGLFFYGKNTIRFLGSVKNFVLDQILNIVTFNMYDMTKGALGITSNKAFRNIAGDAYTSTKSNKYTPYEGIYQLGNYDLVISTFNIQAQTLMDLFPIRNINKSKIKEEEIIENYTKKTETIKKIIEEITDVSLLVEMYDSFNTNEFHITLKNFNCDMDKFLKDIIPPTAEYTDIKKLVTNKINKKQSTEYGVCIAKNKDIIRDNKELPINNPNDISRNAVHTTIDISHLNIEQITTLHILWLHNVYQENSAKNKNIYEVRRQNVNLLIQHGDELLKDPSNAVIIAGDFNLNIYNYAEYPSLSSSFEKNATMRLNDICNFTSMNNRATVVDQKGEISFSGNPYDNALVSKNLALNKYISVFPFIYSMEDVRERKCVSDHVPLMICLKKQ